MFARREHRLHKFHPVLNTEVITASVEGHNLLPMEAKSRKYQGVSRLPAI